MERNIWKAADFMQHIQGHTSKTLKNRKYIPNLYRLQQTCAENVPPIMTSLR